MAIDIATARTEIAKLYIAAFNRVPDSAGLNFWVDSYVNKGQTLDQIANNFTNSTEYTTKYPSYQTTAEYVEKVYVNVFGRASDAAGKAYWVARLDNAATAADHLTHGTLMNAMVAAAASNGSTDGAKLANQATFAVQSVLDNVPTATATAQLANITSDAATVTTATAAVAGSTGATTGSTYALTTGTDIITGTDGNDTISAARAATAAAATDTLTSADTINGGAGTDTLTVTSTAANTDATGGAIISNVEVVNLRQTTAGVDLALSASNTSGATTINNYLSSGTVTVTNMAAGSTIGVVGNGAITQQTTTFAYAATGSANIAISGGTTAGNITNSGVSSATNTITSSGANNTVGTIDLGTGTNVTSLTINASKALNASLAADYAANSTITISGAATNTNTSTGLPSSAVDLTGAALSTNIVTVTASGLTAGGAGVQMGANTTSFVGGQGNDTVVINGLVYNTTGTLAAGAGSADVIQMNDQAALTSVTAAKMSGFEILSLTDDNDAALDTFNMALLSGLTGLVLNADSAGDGYTVTGMTATQAANVQIAGTQAVTPTFTVTGATTVGQLDTLSITASDNLTAANTLTVANLTAAGVETLNINAVDNFTATLLTGMTAVTNINVTGAGAVSLTTGALAANVNTVANASAATGNVTIDATALTTNGISITGTTSTKVNTLTGSAQADTITGGAGADILSGLAGNDAINGGAGNDTITGGAGVDTINVGEGTDTIKFATVDAETLTGVIATGADMTNADKVTGLGNLDKIDLATGGGTAGGTFADGAISVGTTYSAGVANEMKLISGSYDATTKVFTAGAASTTNNDYIFQYNGGATATTVNSIVLIDIVGTLTATSASEVITFTVA